MIEIFGDLNKTRKRNTEILLKEAEKKGLLPSKALISKAFELKEVLKNRNGVVLFGPTLAGKTTAYQVS
jgi:flagellar biosynthesis GTPase FlhF